MIYTQGDQMRTKYTIHELKQFLLYNTKKDILPTNLEFIIKM